MDLGISGRVALVCGASRGLGRACADALAENGACVTIVGRREDMLQRAASEISAATGMDVGMVVADVVDEDDRKRILAACGAPDILVTNAAGPPPGDFRSWSEQDWIAALRANMLAPIALIRATIDPMIERRFGRIVNITSAAVKAPIANLGLSNGSRSGLTGFLAGLARDVAQHNVTINNLLPGPFDTDRLDALLKNTATRDGIDIVEARRRRERQIPAGRIGQPREFGQLCAAICADFSGYMTGQNIVLDGGSYPGLL